MTRVRLAVGVAAVAGALFGGTAHADDPIRECFGDPGTDTYFCLYFHQYPPCVDGGGRIAGERFMLAPCHL